MTGDDSNLIASWREQARADALPAHYAILRAAMSEGSLGHRRALAVFEAYTRDLGDGGNSRKAPLGNLILDVHSSEWYQAFSNLPLEEFHAARDAYVETFIGAFDELMMAWRATPIRSPAAGPDAEEARWLGFLQASDLLAAAVAPPARRGLRRFLPR